MKIKTLLWRRTVVYDRLMVQFDKRTELNPSKALLGIFVHFASNSVEGIKMMPAANI
jgi:hypothetical protein